MGAPILILASMQPISSPSLLHWLQKQSSWLGYRFESVHGGNLEGEINFHALSLSTQGI